MSDRWQIGVCALFNEESGEILPGTLQLSEYRHEMVGSQAIVSLKRPPVWDPAPSGATHMVVLDSSTSTILFRQELPHGKTVGQERISFR